MIPRIVDGEVTEFGIASGYPLNDTISCKVTEERNGDYSLTMVVSADDEYADRIRENKIIVVDIPTRYENMLQGFDIRRITTESNKRITIEADHVSRRMKYATLPRYAVVNPDGEDVERDWTVHDLIVNTMSRAMANRQFTFHSNMNDRVIKRSTYITIGNNRTVMSEMFGKEKSIIDLYGNGWEWEFRNFHVYLWESRGKDSNLRIQYGTNAKYIKKEMDLSNVYTYVWGYWNGTRSDGMRVFHNMENYPPQPTPHWQDYVFARIMPLDTTDIITTANITSSDILQAVRDYINSHSDLDIPKIKIDVDYIALNDAEDPDKVEAYNSLKLCDTVHVFLEKLNTEVTAKVVKTVYDVLAERYEKITIGNYNEGLIKKLVASENTMMKNIRSKVSG